MNDAPLVKALISFSPDEIFEGTNLRAEGQGRRRLWQAILGAAAEAEEKMRGE